MGIQISGLAERWSGIPPSPRSLLITEDEGVTVATPLSSFDEYFRGNVTNKVSLTEVFSTHGLSANNSSAVVFYTGTDNITAYIGDVVNVEGYNTTYIQLSSGSIMFAIDSEYSDGQLISYANLYESAGQGSTMSIVRLRDNIFILNGLLQ